MTTTLITWGIIGAYLAVGLAYARVTIQRWARDPRAVLANDPDSGDKAGVALGALVMGLFWPLAMGFLALRDWLWKPADKDKARRDQMQQDRQHWLRESGSADTPEARAAAKTIADTLGDLLGQEGK